MNHQSSTVNANLQVQIRIRALHLTCALLLLGCLVPLHGQSFDPGQERFKELPNLSCVNERLYRGGQPGKGGMRKLAALGVNTIINLRHTDQRTLAEAEEANAAGLRYFNIPLERMGRPNNSRMEQVLSLITAKENGVVFVHCRRGSDRTGTVIAVYRISHDGWTAKEAKLEAARFGMHFWQWGMKDYISDYFRNRSPRATPKDIRPPQRRPCKIPDKH
jgi:protein tyrosine/serine phosphatase